MAETADALNCSLGTVKSQTARGLDRLRAALDQAALNQARPPVRNATLLHRGATS